MTDNSNRLYIPTSYGPTIVSGRATTHQGDKIDNSTNYFNHTHFHFPAEHATSHQTTRVLANNAHNARAGKGLALLAFDGGVVGGLSDLYVLKRFMHKVAQAGGLHEPPKPCEFFDMISGTSIGGQVAHDNFGARH